MSSGDCATPSIDRRATSVRRRQLLAAAGTTASFGVAGCLGLGGNSDANDDADASPNATDSSTGADGSNGTGGSSENATEGGPSPADVEEGGPPSNDGWGLIFESTFEDGARDRNTWTLGAGYDYTCASMECWSEDNVGVEDGRLVIETTDEPTGDADYTSAAIATRGAFEQEFGYFEAKSRAPAQPGAQPAFWAWWNADDWTYRREIDVYEIYGDDATTATHSVHTDCEPREQGGTPTEWEGGESTLATPADETFHVWGVEWSPQSVAFYVDGEERRRVRDRVIRECFAGEPLWLLLSTQVNDDHGDPATASYPYTHEIDWVRAWQREDWG